MKATEFCKFFEFNISRISKEEYKNIKENDNHWYNFHWADENEDNIYEVSDMQGVFQSRYINDVSGLTECFDCMLDDYINDDVEEYGGFVNDESNTEKSYYEQMLDWMQTSDEYKDSGLCEIVGCLVGRCPIEDDTEREI